MEKWECDKTITNVILIQGMKCEGDDDSEENLGKTFLRVKMSELSEWSFVQVFYEHESD